MTCASPFAVIVSSDELEKSNWSIGFEGSVTVPEYDIPGYKVCTPYWNTGYLKCSWTLDKCAKKWSDGWGGKMCVAGIKEKCTWTQGSTKWSEPCWTTPSVELYPALTFTYSITAPMIFYMEAGVIITTTTPSVPYESSSIEMTTFEFTVNVNDNISKTVKIPLDITFTQINGEYEATIPLTTATGTYVTDGVKYTLDFTFSLLGCMNPEPPIGWLNMEVDCSMTVIADDVESYTTSFSAVCPIVSADE